MDEKLSGGGGGSGTTPKGCLSDLLSNVLIISVPLLPLLSKPRDIVFQQSPAGLRKNGLNSSQGLVFLLRNGSQCLTSET